jgi:hypothetical protein
MSKNVQTQSKVTVTDRYAEIMSGFSQLDAESVAIITNLAHEAVFLEGQLAEIKRYPFMLVNQRTGETKKTAACDEYSQLLSRYNEVIRVLTKARGAVAGDEPSPLERWLEQNGDA